jgi:hypothetical protein
MGAHLYPVNDRKLKSPRVVQGALTADVVQPKTDKEFDALYGKIAADLPLLTKMHDTVIVDDPFHREGPRERFLAAAKQTDKTIFVWIDSPDEFLKSRLPYLVRVHAAQSEEDARARLAERRAQMQFFMPPLIFMHRVSNKRAAERLKQFIEFVISRGFVQLS